MVHENIFGSAIAGALISTAMFRTFVEKGLLTPDYPRINHLGGTNALFDCDGGCFVRCLDD